MSHSKLHIYLAVLFFWGFLVPGSGSSQSTQGQAADPKKDQPIEINADRMRSENGGKKIVFSGNVVGFWGDLKITSDILELYNSEDTQETEEIVAIGNVFISRDNKRAKGDRAVYLDKLQKIILTGTPRATAWEDQNIIEGREMIFLLDKDRFLVNDRVRMKFYPKEETAETGPDKKKISVNARK